MRIHDITFYSAGFFLVGILLASFKLSFLLILILAALMAALFLFIGLLNKVPKFYWLAGLSLLTILGSGYYFYRDARENKSVNIIFDKKIDFIGKIVNDPDRGQSQKLIINLESPYSGKILVKLKPYPSFNYGDLIKFKGAIKQPEPQSYAEYLAKDSVFGITDFPMTELVSENNGSSIKTKLFNLKEKVITNFQKVLPYEKAAFLSGITLGEQAEFSKEFKEKMSKSGTTHLVALSGYNISIIVIAMFLFLNYFLSRRTTFILTVLAIIGFVIMTGMEVSAVRAAIMGFIVLLASQIGRVHSMRNAIVVAALIMVLINPKILYFDIGFQLSFLALIGIIYLSPAIEKYLKIKEDEGFLGWKKNFSTTLSAQILVAPLLIINFGQFSLVGFLANILILEAIPLTMFFGFLMAIMGFISLFLTTILGWFINLILSYEIGVINLFSGFYVPLTKIGFWGILIYYLLVIGFIAYFKYDQRNLSRNNNLSKN